MNKWTNLYFCFSCGHYVHNAHYATHVAGDPAREAYSAYWRNRRAKLLDQLET